MQPSESNHKYEVHAVIGAAMEVYHELRPGLSDKVYQEALEIELTDRGIPFLSQFELPVYYKNRCLKKNTLAGLLAFGKIIVQIKTMDRISRQEEIQLNNQLNATGLEVGLLVNFGAADRLEWKRISRS